ncbi:MAG: dihydropteroate synthase [Verrucomicrobiales bacterium]|nr:dihydropteroate synthase [Verrucomicrobiales bacterium]
MGIVNVTPDSFSDGGQFLDSHGAIEHALKLVEEGADIIDVGGESTRPRATPVSQEEEMRRVLPVIEGLSKRVNVPISIDTMKPAVARAAVQAGASIINDIAANRTDGEMWRLVAETGAGYVLMHMQGTPSTMQENPTYDDVGADVESFFTERLNLLTASGVNAEQVILDIGIGFGKRIADNLKLLAQVRRFAKFGRPMLIGASRKSFVEKVSGDGSKLTGSLACACWAVANGVQIIRAHDVAETRQALRMLDALLERNVDHSSNLK